MKTTVTWYFSYNSLFKEHCQVLTLFMQKYQSMPHYNPSTVSLSLQFEVLQLSVKYAPLNIPWAEAKCNFVAEKDLSNPLWTIEIFRVQLCRLNRMPRWHKNSQTCIQKKIEILYPVCWDLVFLYIDKLQTNKMPSQLFPFLVKNDTSKSYFAHDIPRTTALKCCTDGGIKQL